MQFSILYRITSKIGGNDTTNLFGKFQITSVQVPQAVSATYTMCLHKTLHNSAKIGDLPQSPNPLILYHFAGKHRNVLNKSLVKINQYFLQNTIFERSLR